MEERIGIYSQEAQLNLIRGASKYGLNPHDFSGDFGSWLENKGKYKRLKVYKGYIFIFAKTSNFLYTTYKIPEEFMEEYNEKQQKNWKQVRK